MRTQSKLKDNTTKKNPKKQAISSVNRNARAQPAPVDQLQPPVLRQKKIIINTFNTEYPLIDEVAKLIGWRVVKEQDPTAKEFDLWWVDLGIDN